MGYIGTKLIGEWYQHTLIMKLAMVNGSAGTRPEIKTGAHSVKRCDQIVKRIVRGDGY